MKKLNKYYGESEIKRRDWKGESNQRSWQMKELRRIIADGKTEEAI